MVRNYLKKDFSVFPIKFKSKEPAVAWKEFQTRRPTPEELAGWFPDGAEINVGIVTGALSGVVGDDRENPLSVHRS